jgi:hypothetical protein
LGLARLEFVPLKPREVLGVLASKPAAIATHLWRLAGFDGEAGER